MDVDRKKIYDSKVKEGDRLDVNSFLTLSRIDIKKVKAIQGEIDQYVKKEVPELVAKELAFGSLSTKMELTDAILSIKKVEFELKFLREKRSSVVKNASEEKTDAAKTRIAESDEVYQKYNQEYTSAKIVREYLELKRNDFEQSHYAYKSELEAKRNDRVVGTKSENVGF